MSEHQRAHPITNIIDGVRTAIDRLENAIAEALPVDDPIKREKDHTALTQEWVTHSEMTDSEGHWIDDGKYGSFIRVPATRSHSPSHVDVTVVHDHEDDPGCVELSVYRKGVTVEDGGSFVPFLGVYLTADGCDRLAAALQKAAARIREEEAAHRSERCGG